MSGWRPALRIARREAVRARWRSLLVVGMIALPVAAVVAVDTAARTLDVDAVEALPRTLGAADASVSGSWSHPVEQDATGSDLVVREDLPPVERSAAARSQQLGAALPGARLLPVQSGTASVRTAHGRLRLSVEQLDHADPAAAGRVAVVDGRLPQAPGEVAVTERVARAGPVPGSEVQTDDGRTLRVVGVARPAEDRSDVRLLAAPGTMPLPPPDRWLVDAPGPVTWPQVQRLNEDGLLVLSRAVVLDPPPVSALSPGVADTGSGPAVQVVAVFGLVVAMTLLEVVLLAGPAFAVGARRQRRSLALLAVAGGEPRHLRRVVLAGALVLGGAGSLLGVGLGLAAAYAGRPLLQRLSPAQDLGPFDVSPRDVAIVAASGLGSAALAALVPAVLAARADVTAVLTQRRGQVRMPRALTAAGLVLLALGCAGSVAGARRSGGEFVIAFAAVGAVLGAVLLSPALVGLAGRTARVLPLSARFAVRDAARQRGRTAPAVAAVAATVAGVVALGTGASSDAAEDRAQYVPRGPVGSAVVQAHGAPPETWEGLQRAVQRVVPEAEVGQVRGSAPQTERRYVQYDVCAPGPADACADLAVGSAPHYGSPVLVGHDALALAGTGASADALAAARRALDRGGVVVFADRPLPEERVRVRRTVFEDEPRSEVEAVRPDGAWLLPAARLPAARGVAPAAVVLSEAAAERVGLVPRTVALTVGSALDGDAEDRVQQALAAVDPEASLHVERGPRDRELLIVLALLGTGGAVLVLGGTLTATLLALADARPDLATLGAVGAAPGLRRRIAACHAAAIGILGALLGAAVGLVPGVAVAYPLTGGWLLVDGTGAPVAGPNVFVDVPWSLLGVLVVGVPLLAAAVVGSSTRSALPLTARQPG